MTQITDRGDDIWQQAQELHLADRFDEAEKLYVRLLEQNHSNAGVMATLGSLYSQTNKHGLAIHFLEAAIAAGLKIPDAYTNVAISYMKSGQREKAREYFEKSIAEEPTPEALTNYSGMYIETGEDAKCIEVCERAIAMKHDLPVAHWNMGIAKLASGMWAEGWEAHEWGLIAENIRENRVIVDVPMWDGTPGKTVLVYGEQGLGDEIMFTSMLPDLLKTNTVVYECHKRLETLFKKSFPDVQFYGTREDTAVDWAQNHQFDYRLPIGSLGKFYRRSREAFPGTPYLKADALPKGGKFRIGISWTGGGAKIGRVQKRSIPLPWWKPILDIQNVEFVSLQYTDCKDDLDVMDELGYDIKRMDEYVKAQDYYETARLVASCDLVITCATTVYHLAGALGVPAWVMVPKNPAWREGSSGGNPWYRSVRLYRSPAVAQDAWHAVVARVAHDLNEKVNGRAKLQAVG